MHDIVQPFPYWFGPRCLIPKRPRYYILHNETKTFKESDFDFKKYIFSQGMMYVFSFQNTCEV